MNNAVRYSIMRFRIFVSSAAGHVNRLTKIVLSTTPEAKLHDAWSIKVDLGSIRGTFKFTESEFAADNAADLRHLGVFDRNHYEAHLFLYYGPQFQM